MQAIINNPAGYYFNAHSAINTGGVVRGQLVKVS
jgi:filamentous hemagglutinin family protein